MATPQLVRTAAASVANLVQAGNQVAVVVSAGGDDTSNLISDLYTVTDDNIAGLDMFPIVSLGEEKSVLYFTQALKSMGVKAIPFFPRRHETWPLVADTEDNSPLAKTKINEERVCEQRTEKSRVRFERHVIPRLNSGEVPVLSGCFAINSNDQVITFGRGGSDTTAFQVCDYLDPDELIIVKNVDGLLSGDPKLTQDPERLETLSVEQYEMITRGGTQALSADNSTNRKHYNYIVRIISLKEFVENPNGGTQIQKGERQVVERTDYPVSLVSLISDSGKATEGIDEAAHCLERNGIRILNMTCTKDILSFVVNYNDVASSIKLLHESVIKEKPLFFNVLQREKLGELRVHCSAGGIATNSIAQLSMALAREKIDVLEFFLHNIYIYIYVNYSAFDRAYNTLQRIF